MPSRPSQETQRIAPNSRIDTRSLHVLSSTARPQEERNSSHRQERSGNRASRSRRQHRRITGYHNVFEELSPPDYDVFAPFSPAATAPPPEYACSVEATDVVEIVWERTSPLHAVQMAPWQTVHVALRGTLLQISRAKTHGLLTPAWKRGSPTGEPGHKIKSYTLQHAEVGVASDHKRIEMVPKSPIAQLLPESALKQLQVSDPSQFDIVYNYIARLRVEGEQILLRFQNSEQRITWIEKICAAIDIAPPLEVRSEPRNHTLPRRRRRQEGPRVVIRTTNAQAGVSTNLLAEQDRILREHYPHLLQSTATEPEEHQNSPVDAADSPQDAEDGADQDNDDQHRETENEPDPDYQDLDLAFMRDPMSENDPEDEERHMNQMSNILAPLGQQDAIDGQLGMRNCTQGSTTPSSTPSPQSSHFTFDQIHTSQFSRQTRSMGNVRVVHDPKAPPRHSRHDAVRDARYRRRCMPMLVHNSRYASNIIIHRGKRKVIDWQNKRLTAWPAEPPTYHDVLYGHAPSDPSIRKGEEQKEEVNRDNLPPGAANAVLRLRNMLRRHASSGQLGADRSDEVQDTGPSSREGQSQEEITRHDATRTPIQDLDNENPIQDSPVDPAFFDRPPPPPINKCTQSPETTHSITVTTTTNTTNTTGYTSSSDDQASKSPAISFADPNARTKATNGNTFGRRWRDRFARRFSNDHHTAKNNDATKRPQSRMDSRAQSRATDRFDEGSEDKTVPSRFSRLRTVSSMDIMRNRF